MSNYDNARKAYETIKKKVDAAHNRTIHRFASIADHHQELQRAEDRVTTYEVELKEAAENGNVDQALANLKQARVDLLAAKEAAAVLDRPIPPDTHLQEEFAGASYDFFRAIVFEEMKSFPPEAMTVLFRAYSMWMGRTEKPWLDCLGSVLPEYPTGVVADELRRQVQADHGIKL